MGELGGVAQPLRLARRHGVSHLGLPAALPAARARGHAACRRAARRRPRRRRYRDRRPEPILERLPRAPRRARACRVRRLHARRGDVGALHLAGAPPEAARGGDPPATRPVARDARPARRSHGAGLAAGLHARDRRRCVPAARRPAAARRAHRDHGRHLGGMGKLSRAAGARLGRTTPRSARARRLRARHRRPSCTPNDPLRLMRLVLVGTSHHHAPVELRERVALDPEHASELAQRLGEAVCLSTCNRTELYVVSTDAEDAERRAVAALAQLEPDVEPALYRLRDQAAALHLFRVAAGLDSLVPGEGEILGQVRAAYESGTPGLVLDRVFRQALHAGRKVRAQTAIGESPASVSSAAAALAEQVFGNLEGSHILLIGAGKVGEQAARNLRTRGAEIMLIANSRTDRAELEAQLARADVVVSSTTSPGYVLDAPT